MEAQKTRIFHLRTCNTTIYISYVKKTTLSTLFGLQHRHKTMNTSIYSLTTISPGKPLNISKTNYREAPDVIPNLTYINLEGENMYVSVKQKWTKKVNSIT